MPPRELLARFEFKCDERAFARRLLSIGTQLWLWRVDQQAGAGDFLVVDMSSPDPRRRPVHAVDLKLGADLRRAGSHQLRARDAAAASLACTSAQTAAPLIGGADAVLTYLT